MYLINREDVAGVPGHHTHVVLMGVAMRYTNCKVVDGKIVVGDSFLVENKVFPTEEELLRYADAKDIHGFKIEKVWVES